MPESAARFYNEKNRRIVDTNPRLFGIIIFSY